MQMDVETALADVFNREHQAHPPGEKWENVMRSVAYEVGYVLYPEDAAGRTRFLDAANLSGLFPPGEIVVEGPR